MALFGRTRQGRPLFTVLALGAFWFTSFGASVAVSSQTDSRGPNQSSSTIEPTLGWLGGEPGSRALRLDGACNAAELKRGSLAKVGRHLAALYCNAERRTSSNLAAVIEVDEEKFVTIDSAAVGAAPELAAALKALGARAISIYPPVVSARLPIARNAGRARRSWPRAARSAIRAIGNRAETTGG